MFGTISIETQIYRGHGLNMDRFTGLAVFAKVVEAANFPRRRGVAPHVAGDVAPSMSSGSEQLGVRLHQSHDAPRERGEVGQTYYEHCLRILAKWKRRTAPPRFANSAARPTKVTAPVSFGTRQLAPAIADYLVAYPNVSIDLSLHDQRASIIRTTWISPSVLATFQIRA